MNSLRMSFWMVPASFSRGTPCSSPATTKHARIGSTAPFMVIETVTWSSGMPSKRTFMSSTESIATPALPTSPARAGGPSRSRGGSRDRRPPRGPAGRRPGWRLVEGVRLLGGGEARVLAQGPGPVRVHGGARPAQEGEQPGSGVGLLERLEVLGRVERLDRRMPSAVSTDRASTSLPRSSFSPVPPALEVGAQWFFFVVHRDLLRPGRPVGSGQLATGVRAQRIRRV